MKKQRNNDINIKNEQQNQSKKKKPKIKE